MGWRLFPALLITFSIGGLAAAQEDDEEAYLPGLVAEFQQDNLPPFKRLEAVVAADWTTRPDERLRAGEKFKVTYRGVLDVPDDGTYQLHVFTNGQIRVLLDGKEWVRSLPNGGWSGSAQRTLTFGPLPLEIQFTSTDQPAHFGFFWSSDRFEREPVPARVLKHAREIVVPSAFEQGHVLSRALRCEACHTPPDKASEPLRAPALDQLAGNLQREWLVNWLRDDGSHNQFGDVAPTGRRMPFLNIPAEEAEFLADWLLE